MYWQFTSSSWLICSRYMLMDKFRYGVWLLNPHTLGYETRALPLWYYCSTRYSICFIVFTTTPVTREAPPWGTFSQWRKRKRAQTLASFEPTTSWLHNAGALPLCHNCCQLTWSYDVRFQKFANFSGSFKSDAESFSGSYSVFVSFHRLKVEKLLKQDDWGAA